MQLGVVVRLRVRDVFAARNERRASVDCDGPWVATENRTATFLELAGEVLGAGHELRIRRGVRKATQLRDVWHNGELDWGDGKRRSREQHAQTTAYSNVNACIYIFAAAGIKVKT